MQTAVDRTLVERDNAPATVMLGITARAQKIATRSLLLVLGIWFATILLHQIDVGGTWMPLQPSTWIVLATWLACFTISYAVVLAHYSRAPIVPTAPPPADWWDRSVIALCIVAGIGASLVIYDFAILRGYGFATSVAAIRTEEGTAFAKGMKQSSAISGLGRLMLPAIMPAYMLATYRWRSLSSAARITLAVCSIIALGEQMLFEGGRFFITALVAVVIICYFVSPSTTIRRRIPAVRIAITAVVLMTFFSYVFVDRILERGDFFWSAYLTFSKAFTIYVNYETVGRFEGVFGGLWFSLCMLWIYATHGFSELDQVLSLAYFNHAHGLYQVPHASHIARILFGSELEYDLMGSLPNTGTYLTFYGANYIDFGSTGAMLSGVVLGGLTARGMLGFSSGRLGGMSLIGPMLLVICLFTPAVSLVTNLWPAIVWAAIIGVTARRWQQV